MAVVLTSCSNDDEPKNHAPVSEDVVLSLDENPTSDLLTVLVATDLDSDALTYSIVSQTPANSVFINSATGSIFIQNINAFDFEQNTIIVVNVEVSDGVNITSSKLTINILDVNENT